MIAYIQEQIPSNQLYGRYQEKYVSDIYLSETDSSYIFIQVRRALW